MKLSVFRLLRGTEKEKKKDINLNSNKNDTVTPGTMNVCHVKQKKKYRSEMVSHEFSSFCERCLNCNSNENRNTKRTSAFIEETEAMKNTLLSTYCISCVFSN